MGTHKTDSQHKQIRNIYCWIQLTKMLHKNCPALQFLYEFYPPHMLHKYGLFFILLCAPREREYIHNSVSPVPFHTCTYTIQKHALDINVLCTQQILFMGRSFIIRRVLYNKYYINKSTIYFCEKETSSFATYIGDIVVLLTLSRGLYGFVCFPLGYGCTSAAQRSFEKKAQRRRRTRTQTERAAQICPCVCENIECG